MRARVAGPALPLILLLGGALAFAPGKRTSAVTRVCSMAPVAELRDSSASYFVATATPDTILAGAGAIRRRRYDVSGSSTWESDSGRKIFGQIVIVSRLAGAASAIEESAFERNGRREAVVVPWSYDTMCQFSPWTQSSRWLTDTTPGFYATRLRATADWSVGRPTYDLLGSMQPYPQAAVFRPGYYPDYSGVLAGGLSAAEHFDLYAALPDWLQASTDSAGAFKRLRDWEAAHPGTAERFPANLVLTQARRLVAFMASRRR